MYSRDEEENGAVEGACPMCGSKVTAKWKPLNFRMIKLLLLLETGNEQEFIDKIINTDLELLVLWGFIDENNIPGLRTYIITDLGRRFLAGGADIPKRLKIYKGKVLEESKQLVNIKMFGSLGANPKKG